MLASGAESVLGSFFQAVTTEGMRSPRTVQQFPEQPWAVESMSSVFVCPQPPLSLAVWC